MKRWPSIAPFLCLMVAACSPAATSIVPTNGTANPGVANLEPSTAYPTTTVRSASLLLIRGSQQFPPLWTYQIGLGDFDADGDLDAAFANMRFNNSQVWLNDGRGTFTDSGQRLTQLGHGVGVGDLDGDGDLDLVITCASMDSDSSHFTDITKVYLNDGLAGFEDTGQDLRDRDWSGNAFHLIDIENDGDLDIHIEYFDLPDKVYLNDGSAVFMDSGLAIPENAVWGDLDADGDVDIFSKEIAEGYSSHINDGSGDFAAYWQMSDPNAILGGMTLGDFDGDGDLDAFVANGYREEDVPSRVLLNDGTGRFIDSGQSLGPTRLAHLGTGDLDGDGDLDVFVSNAFSNDEVWINDGAGFFENSGLVLEETGLTTEVSLGDLDNDGDLDVMVGNFEGRVAVWFNESISALNP